MRTKKMNKQSSAQKTGKRRWLLKLGMLILLVGGIYFGGRYVFNVVSHTMFPVKEIVFSGNKHLTDNELKAIMGLKENEGLIGISSRDLSAKLLKSAWVRSVSFRKDFPHRLLVRIEESAPYALLEMNGRTFFVDDRGNLLEEIKGDSVPFLPVISGDPFKNSDTFSEALNLVKAMKGKGFINMKGRVEVIMPKGAGPEDISMQVDGTLVKVGYGEYEEKLGRLIELEDEIRKRGIPVDYIDLRFANRVVVKPISEVIR
ncbi:MAG: FtsQ-type POTRA domain-containing protein [Thermodesulfovibrionales bacterium]|nr:FtsQ-type POTRA domain-containing protein [Thermodesulfovibrionales bacterium]